ncbi:MAG: hypothetical protein LBT50_00720 [Prevotellaceae bacterium]|jgi:hypothetical protein|nr:hypothetical protein [Prevotellaceae bacterium]
MYDVYYVNNTSFDMYYYVAFGDKENSVYPDILISFNKEELGRIKAQSYFVLATWKSIESLIDKIPSDTLSIYYFHPDTLNKYSWKEIQQGYKVLRRYDLSIEDIHSLKNEYDVPEIPYPPTEAMKNMKMYPPYEK